jgi:hypothetical protein
VGQKKDFQREEKLLREVQPVPGDAQDGLGASPGTGCTEIKQMTTAGKFFIETIDVAVQSSSNQSLKPHRNTFSAPWTTCFTASGLW